MGGVETATRLLAEAFSKAGHPATVVTREADTSHSDTHSDTNIIRRPGILSLLRLYHRADAVIVQGMALCLGWPLLLRHRCALIVHHAPSTQNESAVTQRLRVALGSRARHATVSRAMVRRLPWPIEAVLPNPYDAALFLADTRGRTRDVAFVGRLIQQKGAHVLVEALGILHRAGRSITATIIGSGPERAHLEKLAHERGVYSWIDFAGQVAGSSLARRLNEHRILVVPSLDEAFGIVALEGAACGCAVIASDVGGLPEAVGPSGCLFPAGDAATLAAKLIETLDCEVTPESVQLRGQGHLQNHTPAAVAREYLKILLEMRRTEQARSAT